MTKFDMFTFKLAHGNHPNPQAGTCFMEAVAWMAREPHSDRPKCACPVLGAYGIRVNDHMNDAERVALNPLILKMLNTRSPAHVEARLAHLIQAGATRILAPILEARGWAEEGVLLRTLAPGTPRNAMLPTLRKVRDMTAKRRAAAAADAAADAAAAAYADAYAAAATATAADAAAAAATAAAAAAAAATAAAAASKRIGFRSLWARESVAILNEAIELGPHNAEEYPQPEFVERVAAFREKVLARVD